MTGCNLNEIKGGKKLSSYNKFMKKEIAKLKETNNYSDHKEIFKLAAKNWSKSKK